MPPTPRPTLSAMEPEGPVPLPLYHRVYVVLRQQIAEGRWEPDAAMPGEHDLSEAFKVSRITIRRALDRLERENLITRRRGSGTFAQPAGDVAPIRQSLSGLLENLLTMGLKTSVRVLDFAYTPAPAEVAAALEIPPRTVVQKAVRVRAHHNEPFSFLTTWVPEDIGRKFKRSDMARRPLLALLEDSGYAASRADQVISARLADTQVASELNMEVGAALLYVRRTVRDPQDRVVEYIQALYRPELYEYHMGMKRVSRSGKSVWSAEAEPHS